MAIVKLNDIRVDTLQPGCTNIRNQESNSDYVAYYLELEPVKSFPFRRQ